MATTNPITGDSLISKPTTKEYEEGWERIFGKPKEVVDNGVDSLIKDENENTSA